MSDYDDDKMVFTDREIGLLKENAELVKELNDMRNRRDSWKMICIVLAILIAIEAAERFGWWPPADSNSDESGQLF